jgi:hypothetical protein
MIEIVRYRGHVIGWRTGRGRVFVIDALTARAIRIDKQGGGDGWTG